MWRRNPSIYGYCSWQWNLSGTPEMWCQPNSYIRDLIVSCQPALSSCASIPQFFFFFLKVLPSIWDKEIHISCLKQLLRQRRPTLCFLKVDGFVLCEWLCPGKYMKVEEEKCDSWVLKTCFVPLCCIIEAICHSPVLSHPPPTQKTWAYSLCFPASYRMSTLPYALVLLAWWHHIWAGSSAALP